MHRQRCSWCACEQFDYDGDCKGCGRRFDSGPMRSTYERNCSECGTLVVLAEDSQSDFVCEPCATIETERVTRCLRRILRNRVLEDHGCVAVWPFYEAPEELRDLSRCGGDEDWLVVIPPSRMDVLEHGVPSWVERMSACGDADRFDLGGWVVFIGSHS